MRGSRPCYLPGSKEWELRKESGELTELPILEYDYCMRAHLRVCMYRKLSYRIVEVFFSGSVVISLVARC